MTKKMTNIVDSGMKILHVIILRFQIMVKTFHTVSRFQAATMVR